MMKLLAFFGLLALSQATVVQKDRTITKVVKLLQGMLEKSKSEGDEEKVIYTKFKCYCDTSEEEKKTSINDETKQIALLETDIEEIQGGTGGLSSECAELKAQMADNEDARKDATRIRNKEKKAFEAEVEDLEQGIAQMKAAIETLAAVGGDQTKSTGADNKQFMAGGIPAASMLDVSQVQKALSVASGLMTIQQQRSAAAFLQAPFTGTYTSQSGAVTGIIKNMRDTFEQNLEDAKVTEKNSKAAYEDLMEIKNKAFKEMKASYTGKQKDLGGNDNTLSTKKKQLSIAKKQKAADENFLYELLPMCADKAEAYANRKLLRANEEAAIAEAISILNTDDAFATFGTTSATSSGKVGIKKYEDAFIQLSSVRRHEQGNVHARQMAQEVVQKAAKEAKSVRLSKVLAKLQGDNPFDTVLAEIDKMIELIAEEGAEDKSKLDWCKSERNDNKELKKEHKHHITGLKHKINDLTSGIENPEDGLKTLIEQEETKIMFITKAQKEETASRTDENIAYQTDVRNLVKAQSILAKATKVLKAYYDDLEEKLSGGLNAFVQEDPKPPSAWKGDETYAGQSEQGGDILEMLSFIYNQTVKEEHQAHKDEDKAQSEFEKDMKKLQSLQKKHEANLVDLQDDLAEDSKDLLETQEDLKATTDDKEAVKAYLLKIKPGCDFIKKNYRLRKENRGIEKAALELAMEKIKGTPAYTTAVNSATLESYGDCKGPCGKDSEDVECKACMADVTVPAYCAGHEGAKGC